MNVYCGCWTTTLALDEVTKTYMCTTYHSVHCQVLSLTFKKFFWKKSGCILFKQTWYIFNSLDNKPQATTTITHKFTVMSLVPKLKLNLAAADAYIYTPLRYKAICHFPDHASRNNCIVTGWTTLKIVLVSNLRTKTRRPNASRLISKCQNVYLA